MKYLSEHNSIPEPPSLILTCRQHVSQVFVSAVWLIAVIPLCLWRVLVSQHLRLEEEVFRPSTTCYHIVTVSVDFTLFKYILNQAVTLYHS